MNDLSRSLPYAYPHEVNKGENESSRRLAEHLKRVYSTTYTHNIEPRNLRNIIDATNRAAHNS